MVLTLFIFYITSIFLVHVKKVPLSLASDLGEPETLGALLDGFQQIVSQLVVGLEKKPLQLQKMQYVLWMRDIFVQIRLRIRTSDQ